MEIDKENWHYLRWPDTKKPMAKAAAKILNGELTELEFFVGSVRFTIKSKSAVEEVKRICTELLNFLDKGDAAGDSKRMRKLRPKSLDQVERGDEF